MAWYFLGIDKLFARRNTAQKPAQLLPKPKPTAQAPASSRPKAQVRQRQEKIQAGQQQIF